VPYSTPGSVAAPSRGVKKGQSQPWVAFICIFLWVKPFETILNSAYMSFVEKLNEIFACANAADYFGLGFILVQALCPKEAL
jgi:hypothetical protein